MRNKALIIPTNNSLAHLFRFFHVQKKYLPEVIAIPGIVGGAWCFFLVGERLMLGPKTDRGLPEDGPPERGDIFYGKHYFCIPYC